MCICVIFLLMGVIKILGVEDCLVFIVSFLENLMCVSCKCKDILLVIFVVKCGIFIKV